MVSIYLAGPDVFYPDSQKRKDHLLSLCQQYQFIGCYPGDNEVDPPSANAIRTLNLQILRETDYVIANLNPFRGFEPDSGTAFEIGYAMALNKTVIGYAEDSRPLIDRLREYQSLPRNQTHDEEGLMIEDYNLPNNLMFGHIVIANNAQQAIKIVHDIHHMKSEKNMNDFKQN